MGAAVVASLTFKLVDLGLTAGKVPLLCVSNDSLYIFIQCPTRYRTRHFYNNFTNNEDIATKFEADLPHCAGNVTTS